MLQHFETLEIIPIFVLQSNILSGEVEAKFRIEPEIVLIENNGLKLREIRQAVMAIEENKEVIIETGRNILNNNTIKKVVTIKAQKVWFDNGHIYIIADDGREGNLPVRLFPRLYNASEEQLQKFTLSHHGIHWMELDEDLSYEGFFSEENASKEKHPLKNIFFKFPEFNRRQVARIAGINPSLFQQNVDGIKTPSSERMKDIENAIRRLGSELTKISLQ